MITAISAATRNFLTSPGVCEHSRKLKKLGHSDAFVKAELVEIVISMMEEMEKEYDNNALVPRVRMSRAEEEKVFNDYGTYLKRLQGL